MNPAKPKPPAAFRCFTTPTYESDLRGIRRALGARHSAITKSLLGVNSVIKGKRARRRQRAPPRVKVSEIKGGKFQPLDGFILGLARKSAGKRKTFDAFDKFCCDELNKPDKYGHVPAKPWTIAMIRVRRMVLSKSRAYKKLILGVLIAPKSKKTN